MISTTAGALGAIGAAGAGLSLSGCVSSGRLDDVNGPGALDERGGRIIVIGAGFGGLVCADALARRGRDVLLLEARARVGGRVVTLRNLGARYAEGGGEWIGMNHPGWISLADRFGLELVEATEEDGDPTVVLEGERLTVAAVESLYEEMETHLRAVNRLARPIRDPARPWLARGAEELDAQSVADWMSPRTMSSHCRAAITAMLEHDNAVPLGRMSLLGLLALVAGGGGESFWTDSEVYRCRDGNQRLAEALARAIGSQRIRFGATVRAIDLDAERCTVHTDDATLHADSVVLATPASTWHTLSVRARDGEAVSLPSVQMGAALKYLATARNAWWRDARLSPDSASDGLFGYTWNAGDGQEPVGGGDEIICGFGGGPALERLPEGRSARVATFRSELEGLLPGFAAAHRTARNPQERQMVWTEDPLAGAAYSFPDVGAVTTSMRALHDGIALDDRTVLRFAGEHCSPAFVGYMEGAIQSGLAVARHYATASQATAHSR